MVLMSLLVRDWGYLSRLDMLIAIIVERTTPLSLFSGHWTWLWMLQGFLFEILSRVGKSTEKLVF
jgi:hypothetical protein